MVLPVGCSVQENVLYTTVGGWNGYLDLYLPRDRSKPVPIVLLFHGGGWNHGAKEDVQRGVLPFLKLGWAVANVEYRLLQVAPAPAAVEDARCALLWLVAHAETLGLDPERIITTGSSAGAHLALMAGLLPPGSQFDKNCAAGTRYRVAVIINKYGITDVVDALKRTHWLDGVPNKTELAKNLSPLTYVRKDIPPIISIHGDEDPVVPYEQAVRLHKLLDSVGCINRLYTVHGGGHGKFDYESNRAFAEVTKQFLMDIGLIDKK
jgi:acetyl esterase/lipase